MVADLFNAPDLDKTVASSATGTSTIGSSEAVMLGGLAMKWLWKAKKTGGTPNLILGSNVQVVWEKFCRYFEVEPHYLPMEEGRYVITPEQVLEAVDENTIGVVVIAGTTYTGELEPVKEIADALDKLAADGGVDVPIHVDAASGGFVLPFLHPDLEWDFRIPRVVSINVSGHKYGLTYPGVGFVVWRGKEWLPEDLIFRVNYLGGDMPTLTLNFSRPGNQVIAQYYNFLRLGRQGFSDIMKSLSDTAQWFAGEIAQEPEIEIITDGSAIPVVTFQLHDSCEFTAFDVSHGLRAYGWQVPAYTMPDNVTDLAVLRVVVREGFSRDMSRVLHEHLVEVMKELRTIKTDGNLPQKQHFAH